MRIYNLIYAYKEGCYALFYGFAMGWALE